MTFTRFIVSVGIVSAIVLGNAGAASAQAAAAEKITQLKANLAASKAALLKYQWTETTTVSLNGQVKSTKVNQVTHGPDGSVVKTDVSPPAPPPPGGLRGRIIANKKEELTDYIEQAVALVKAYVPPMGEMIEAARTAGTISIGLAPNGVGATVTIANYLKPGDKLAITVEPGSDQITGLNVSTYLTDASQPVTLAVTMGVLPGNISYPANIVLNAPAKGITVDVTNSNYIRTGK
jgi:hypothetical protein